MLHAKLLARHGVPRRLLLVLPPPSPKSQCPSEGAEMIGGYRVTITGGVGGTQVSEVKSEEGEGTRVLLLENLSAGHVITVKSCLN